jgi:hypothetical protein
MGNGLEQSEIDELKAYKETGLTPDEIYKMAAILNKQKYEMPLLAAYEFAEMKVNLRKVLRKLSLAERKIEELNTSAMTGEAWRIRALDLQKELDEILKNT